MAWMPREALQALCSGDDQRQLQALCTLLPWFSNVPLADNVLDALVQHALGNDHNKLIRKMAFKCAQVVVTVAPHRWGLFRLAVMTEMQAAEDKQVLSAAIDTLSALNDQQLVMFFGSKDGMSAVKSCCLVPELKLRALAIKQLGRLALRVWETIEQGVDLEQTFESFAENRRFEQDIKDFVNDLFKSFAEEFTGKGELKTDNACLSAYAIVFGEAFARYYEYVDPVQRWLNKMLGQPVTALEMITWRARSVAFSSLVSKLLPYFVEDTYHVLNRWRLMTSKLSAGYTKLISIAMAILLRECHDMITPGIDASVTSAFAPFGETVDESSVKASRSEPLPQNAQQLAEEWVLRNLSEMMSCRDVEVAVQAARQCLCITQDPRMTLCRLQVAPQIVECLLRAIDVSVSSQDTVIKHLTRGEAELSLLAVLALRHTPRSMLSIYVPEVCKNLSTSTNRDVRIRLYAEIAVLILCGLNTNGRVAQSDVLNCMLKHPWIIATLQDARPTNGFREGFVAALCRVAARLGPVVLSYVIKESQAEVTESFQSQTTAQAANMYVGLGTYAEVEGATLGSMFPELELQAANGEQTDEPNSAQDETSHLWSKKQKQDVENWLAESLSILKTFTKCVNWSSTAGHHAQQAYVNLLALVCKLLVANTNFPNPCAEKQWAVNELKEISSTLLEWHLRDSISSLWCRLQLVKLLCQHLPALCGGDDYDINNRATDLLQVIKSDLMSSEERRAFQFSLQSAREGMIGGGKKEASIEPYEFIFQQMWVLTSLETLCSAVPTISGKAMDVVRMWEQSLRSDAGTLAVLMPPPLKESIELVKRRVAAIAPYDVSRIEPVAQAPGPAVVVDLLDLFAEATIMSPRRPVATIADGKLDWIKSVSSMGYIDDRGLCRDDGMNSSIALSSAEVMATVDAVIDEHLHAHWAGGVPTVTTTVLTSASMSDATILSAPSNFTEGWTALSGGCDLLTVLARHRCMPDTHVVEMQIKVINGSGFKIPFFRLEVQVSNCARGAVQNRSYVRDGVEWMAREAVAVRSLCLMLESLDSHIVKVQILYPDLNAESVDDLYPDDAPRSAQPTDEDDDDFRGSQAQSDAQKVLCTVDCKPYVIAMIEQLIPHADCLSTGTGADSAESHIRHKVLPLNVFRSVWHACKYRTFHAVMCSTVDHPCVAMSLVEKYPGAERVTAAAVKGPGINVSPGDGAWVGSMNHNGAWAFRTWWGHPVVFKLTATRVGLGQGDRLKGMWVGRVEVATSSAVVVQNIRKSWAHVISWLTFGIYETVDNSLDPLTSRFSSAEYVPLGVRPDPSDQNSVGQLPANAMEMWSKLQPQRQSLRAASRPVSPEKGRVQYNTSALGMGALGVLGL